MPTMSVMPQQQQPQMQMQQQYPIYASGAQMTNHLNQQNGGPPIYVPSSISIQNSLNSVASGMKPSPSVAPMIPSHQNVNGNGTSNYGHGQMMQQPQQIPQAPQYIPSLQQQVSVPAAPVPPPPPAFQNNAPCPPAAPQMPNIAQVAPNNANAGAGAPPPPPPPPMSTLR